MNYKEKLDEIRALVFGKEEKLAEEAPMEQEAAPSEEAPKPVYVTAEQFSAMKDEMESFKSDTMEILSKLTEMINSTEKNKVPTEMAEEPKEEVELKEEVKEEVVEEKVEELSAPKGGEALIHDPEGLVSNRVKTKLAAGRKKTTEDIVFEALANAGVWNQG